MSSDVPRCDVDECGKVALWVLWDEDGEESERCPEHEFEAASSQLIPKGDHYYNHGIPEDEL